MFNFLRQKRDPVVQQEINKRLTLNMLIHGAAAHTFVTASHLVQDELEEIAIGLTNAYDQFTIAGQLNYLMGEIAFIFGWPNQFWGFSSIPKKILQPSQFLRKYTQQLARESKAELIRRAAEKGMKTGRFAVWWAGSTLGNQLIHFEEGFQNELADIATKAVCEIWDFPADKLDAEITRNVAFGRLQPPKTFGGKFYRMFAIGYSGVSRTGDTFKVVAKAWFFPILVHELVKGIMELICIHGLNRLDDDTYQQVMVVADQLEHEPWMLQAGAEMWRRFLAVAPRDFPLANHVMNVANLSPQRLEKLMLLIMEEPNRATEMLRQLSKAH